MVDRAYKNLNSEFMDNHDARGRIENYKTGQPICIEDADPTVPKFMSQIWHQGILCQRYQLMTKLLQISTKALKYGF